MCGLAGFCAHDPLREGEARACLQAMTRSLIPRGPDEEGFHVGRHAALGSRRLRVIDLEAGPMPLANEDGSVFAVYNGEIYNFRELRAELEDLGHRFRTRTDTEVLVHLYEEEGGDLVHRLEGMFAFAIWDAEARKLLLARDRLGIKPLFYRPTDGGIAFGSELKALTAESSETPDLDVEAIVEYLALGYIRAPLTIFRGYRKLPPGHSLEWGVDRPLMVRRYWRPPTGPEAFEGTVDKAVEELEALLLRSVEARLVADVPLGAFLSGGVDSSLVCALAASVSGTQIETFCLGWEGSPEPRYARMVADHIGSEHHELTVDSGAAEAGLELLRYFDEPFGDSSCIPTYRVSELARSHVTVALSGDGGDELFGGYQQYVNDRRLAWTQGIPRSLRRLAFGLPARLLRPGAPGRRRLHALCLSRQERFVDFVSAELDPRRGGILHPDLYGDEGLPFSLFAERFQEARSLSKGNQLLYADLTSYLPDDILTKVDRMSMAHSLEARVPLLDHRVVEFAFGLPIKWKLQGRDGKWILREVAKRYLPREVLERPKHGFSIPVARWLREDLRPWTDRLTSGDGHAMRFLHRPAVERIVREHMNGVRNHPSLIWRLLVLEHWLQEKLDSARASRSAEADPARV